MIRRARLRRQSPKHRRAQAAWADIVRQRIEEVGGVCQIKSPICSGRGCQGHHRLARSQGGPNTPENCVVCCHACHNYAHGNTAWSIARGFIESRKYAGRGQA